MCVAQTDLVVPLDDAKEWAERVEGTLINPSTLLATDYLNHFNEVQMLLEMVPDMPEMLEDCKAWQPKSYPQHFLDCSLSYGALAAEAYEHVPHPFRAPFEDTIARMDQIILTTVADLESALSNGEPAEAMRERVTSTMTLLQALNQLASDIIHGASSALDQANIDKILAA